MPGKTKTKKAAAAAAAVPAAPPVAKKGMAQEVQLLICALGIYACYLRYGVLQERIYKAEHGDGEKYQYSLFLVFVQTLTNAAVALLVMQTGLFSSSSSSASSSPGDKNYDPKHKPSSWSTPFGVPIVDYAFVSLAYLLAMVFSFTALNHMSYPMQALGKSCKMVPVMLMGIVIRRKRYTPRDFMCVLLITLGVILFSYKSKKGGSDSAQSSSWLGVVLLVASLFMDGVTGPLQERLVARFSPSTHQLMFWQNFTAAAWLAVALAISGEGLQAIAFITRFPDTLRDIFAFSFVSALGQNFIFYTVRNFNALVVTTITTTRKMFTILLSIFIYRHPVKPLQWLGLGLVFAAITWEAAAKQRAKAERERKLKAVAESSTSTELSGQSSPQNKKDQ